MPRAISGDVPVKTRFFDLAKELGDLGVWVRMHYVYPYPHVDEVHPADGRRQDPALPRHPLPACESARSEGDAPAGPRRKGRWSASAGGATFVPTLAIRSTFIVGFPGETDEDFEALLDFVEEADIDRVGCFRYEPVEGAKSNELPGAVPGDVTEERWKRPHGKHPRQSAPPACQARVGREIEVIIDSVDGDGATGRSVWDAPDIDGSVFIPARGRTSPPGDIVSARVVKASEYDLEADLI